MMKQNTQLQTVHIVGRPAQSEPSDVAPGLERRWLEFDRDVVLRQIDLIKSTIDANVNDLGMVAVEGVFDKSLSNGLLRTSRSLQVIAKELNALRSLVVHATGYPKGDKKRA